MSKNYKLDYTYSYEDNPVDSGSCTPTSNASVGINGLIVTITFADGYTDSFTLPITDYSGDISTKADDNSVLHKTGSSAEVILGNDTPKPLSDFATSEQGDKADSAIQLADLELYIENLDLPSDVDILALEQDIQDHLSDFSNPHQVTKSQVGLSNVDNTSDLNKPVSSAQQTAINAARNAAISYTNSTLSSKVDKVTGSRLMTNEEGDKIAAFDEEHYRPDLNTIAELTALPEADLSDNERRYVKSANKDYFYHIDAVSGDEAPDDQTGGTGFWRTSSASGGATNASELNLDNTDVPVFTATELQTFAEQVGLNELTQYNTGIEKGGYITGEGTDTVTISAGRGKILDNTDIENPIAKVVTWDETTFTGLSNVLHWFYVDTNGVVQSTTVDQLENNSHENARIRIQLGRARFRNDLVSGIVAGALPSQHLPAQIFDIFRAIGIIKKGLQLSPASTDLSVTVGDGEIYQPGVGWASGNHLNPHEASFNAEIGATFRHITSANTQSADLTQLDVANYESTTDNVIPIPGANSRAGIHLWMRFPNGNDRVLRPQSFYDNIDDAYTALLGGEYTPTIPANLEEAARLGYIIAAKDTTNLGDNTKVIFVTTNRFGGIGGAVPISQGVYLEAAQNLADLDDALQALANLNGENLDNKAVDFNTVNDNLYPTTKAVADYLASYTPPTRTRKLITNTTQYTVIAADFTDFELVFNADTSGAEIDVIINTGVCPDTEPDTGLQIVSIANHVLNYTGTATLTPQPGAILKTANDGSSMALTGIKPASGVNDLAVFGTLEGDGTGGGGTSNVFTDSEDGLAPKVLNEPVAVVSNITGTTFDATVTAEAGTRKKLTSDGWLDDVVDGREVKVISSTSYNLIPSDKDKYLYFSGANTVVSILNGTFEEGDIIKANNANSNILKINQFDEVTNGIPIAYPETASTNLKVVGGGVFEVKIISGGGVLTGDLVQSYQVRESPDGSLWKISVDNTGTEVITAL